MTRFNRQYGSLIYNINLNSLNKGGPKSNEQSDYL